MEKTLPKIELTTAKGTVSAKVRGILKGKTMDKLETLFPEAKMTEKGLAIAIGVDAYTKETIYAIMSVTITRETESVKKATRGSKAEEAIVPEIFD